jgi:thymidine phosphorylase
MVSLLLGAGRLSKTDPLDFSAGIWLNKIHNESVIVGDVIATLYSSNEITQDIIDRFNNNLLIEEIQFPFLPTIIKAVNNIEIVLKNTF